MEKRQLQATLPADNKKNTTGEDLTAVVEVDYPETLDECKDWCGEDAILTNAFANWRVTLQSAIRTRLAAGMSQEEIQAQLGSSIMGVAAAGVKVDPQQAFLAKFKNATPEEQAQMLQMLRDAAS